MIGKMVNQAFEENADMEKFEEPVEKVISKRWKICYTEAKKKEKREPDERVSFNNFHESGHQRDTNFGQEQMISKHISR